MGRPDPAPGAGRAGQGAVRFCGKLALMATPLDSAGGLANSHGADRGVRERRRLAFVAKESQVGVARRRQPPTIVLCARAASGSCFQTGTTRPCCRLSRTPTDRVRLPNQYEIENLLNKVPTPHPNFTLLLKDWTLTAIRSRPHYRRWVRVRPLAMYRTRDQSAGSGPQGPLLAEFSDHPKESARWGEKALRTGNFSGALQ